MRPYLVGGACHRVREQLDNALSEGALALSPELASHASRCPHCGPQVQQTEALFKRLRSAPANLDLGPVPGAVDSVLQKITAQPAEGGAVVRVSPEQERANRKRKAHLRWVLGQVATIAAVLGIAVGGLTFLALKVNHAVGGAKPAEVVERWVAPLQDWTRALLRSTR